MRTTNEHKDRDIRVRITEDMYRFLEVAAAERRLTVSEYVRKIVLAEKNKTLVCSQTPCSVGEKIVISRF